MAVADDGRCVASAAPAQWPESATGNPKDGLRGGIVLLNIDGLLDRVPTSAPPPGHRQPLGHGGRGCETIPTGITRFPFQFVGASPTAA